MLVEKYRPKIKQDWIGSSYQLNQVLRHVENHIKGKPVFRSIVLSGERGTGKTTLGFIAGNHYNLNVVEVNASDERNKKDIMRIWKTASTSSIDGGRNLILIDEADGLTDASQKSLAELCKTSPSPIIFCVNQEWKLIREIKDISLIIKFKNPTQGHIVQLLNKVCDKENIILPDSAIRRIAVLSTNYRSALNMLELASIDDSMIGLIKDDSDGNIIDHIGMVIDGKPPEFMAQDPTQVIRWMIENTNDFDLVARADIFLRYSRDDYRYWRYASELLKSCRNRRKEFISMPKWFRKGTQSDESKGTKNNKTKPRQSKDVVNKIDNSNEKDKSDGRRVLKSTSARSKTQDLSNWF